MPFYLAHFATRWLFFISIYHVMQVLHILLKLKILYITSQMFRHTLSVFTIRYVQNSNKLLLCLINWL